MRFTRSQVPSEAREFHERTAAAFSALESNPFNGSVIVETDANGAALTFAAGVTKLVPHRLGRRVRYWRVIDQDAAATFYRDRTSTANPDLFLALRSDVAVNAIFEVV